MPVYTNAPGIADLSPLDWRHVGEGLQWANTEPAQRKAEHKAEPVGDALNDLIQQRASKPDASDIALEHRQQSGSGLEYVSQSAHQRERETKHGLTYLITAIVAAGIVAHAFMPSHEGARAQRADLETASTGDAQAATASAKLEVALLPRDVPEAADEHLAPKVATDTAKEEEAKPAVEADASWQTDVRSEQVATEKVTGDAQTPSGPSQQGASTDEANGSSPAAVPAAAVPHDMTASAEPAQSVTPPSASNRATGGVATETDADAKPAAHVAAPSPARITGKPTQNAASRETADGRRQLLLGEKLMARGDLEGARQQFQEAARLGLPEGALALGNTYDPVSLAKFGISAPGDSARARRWYREAYLLALHPERAKGGGQARAASAAMDNRGDSRDGSKTP